MIGQHGIKRAANGTPPIRYEAIDQCLIKVGEFAIDHNCSVHMSRIGCGLAGGQWEKIEPLVIKNLINQGIGVVVYDFG